MVQAQFTMLKQRAKIQWSQEVDINTHFYHAQLKARRTQLQITSLYNSQGDMINEDRDIKEDILNFCKNLLSKSNPVDPIDSASIQKGPIVTQAQGESLIVQVFDSEIKIALFSIGNEKAPGPDGFSAGFFKSCWEIVGNDLILVVKDFFSTGKLLMQIYATNISLIPKIANPNIVADYRLIACCNVVYKIIT